MEYMLAVVALAAIVGWAYTIRLYLNQQQHLLDRIQAPEVAITHAFRDGKEPAKISYGGEGETEDDEHGDA